ncbi:unnamed protein product [Fusarium graminearum]|uniref:Uncharacterized protein n=1 Tax=Gibberella zeae TaxID=5518 RepID=A0A679P634_GIBZA|nr:unnamed protein product [Fusarium graminearum]CAF3540809.1 unnamed protein product [Fusarium graminearum]CAG1968178.1 unnamed protein product [Fusarium graminearum]CAG1994709.1 unnamed protein product [Fusarium graminearum]CZS82270.1 unnamed protein product [Fusarium graminearum]
MGFISTRLCSGARAVSPACMNIYEGKLYELPHYFTTEARQQCHCPSSQGCFEVIIAYFVYIIPFLSLLWEMANWFYKGFSFFVASWALRTALEMLIRHLEHPQHPDQDLDDRPLFMVV